MPHPSTSSCILSWSTGLYRCWRQVFVVSHSSASSICLNLECFGLGAKLRAMSWKLVNLVLNSAKDNRSDTGQHDSNSLELCSVFLLLYSAPFCFFPALFSSPDGQQVGFLTLSTVTITSFSALHTLGRCFSIISKNASRFVWLRLSRSSCLWQLSHRLGLDLRTDLLAHALSYTTCVTNCQSGYSFIQTYFMFVCSV